MKTITAILLVLTVLCVQAQEKFSLSVQLEGVYSMPLTQGSFPVKIEKDFGSGIGLNFSHQIWKTFSANTGLNFRYIQYNRLDKNVGYPIGYPTLDGYQYKQSYLVLPVSLRKTYLNEKLFLEAGLELNRIFGREKKDPQTELLWKIGAGSKVGKLNYSLNYLWGNKEQEDILRLDPNLKIVAYKSRMLQFEVSYPLWQKNK
ncbi:MAG: hypothetical protein Q8S54_05640 [Bacteroidota bacterium]|nr:hypothetical protein [Odoribacter sp.]MDP3642660.1 hypothetical protein [Bacteroidota bacterium]